VIPEGKQLVILSIDHLIISVHMVYINQQASENNRIWNVYLRLLPVIGSSALYRAWNCKEPPLFAPDLNITYTLFSVERSVLPEVAFFAQYVANSEPVLSTPS
jgi:hypothetical protein